MEGDIGHYGWFNLMIVKLYVLAQCTINISVVLPHAVTHLCRCRKSTQNCYVLPVEYPLICLKYLITLSSNSGWGRKMYMYNISANLLNESAEQLFAQVLLAVLLNEKTH